MKNECAEMRRLIEQAIGCDIDPAERDAIEMHCAACVACRSYREDLERDDARLSAFALERAPSIRRASDRTIERIRDASFAAEPSETIDVAPPYRSRPGRMRARIPRFAALAAAVAGAVVLFAALDLFRGESHAPAPAFAAVQEKMQKVGFVKYRFRRWAIGRWISVEVEKAGLRLTRYDYGDSIVVSNSLSPGRPCRLVLYPAARKAVLMGTARAIDFGHLVPRPPDPVAQLAAWHKMRGLNFVRRERRDGKEIAVYEKTVTFRTGLMSTTTARVDLETQLPIELSIAAVPSRSPDSYSQFLGLRLSDFQRDSSDYGSWIFLKPGEPGVIYDEFEWKATPDTSCFSLVPPPGYVVKTLYSPRDTCSGVPGRLIANGCARVISTYLSLSGNEFPESVAAFADSARIRALAIAKYRRGTDPAAEFRSALEAGSGLPCDLEFTRDGRNYWHIAECRYTGAGAAFGDSTRVVYWLKREDPSCPDRKREGPYFLVYADLHVDASATAPKAVTE